MNFKAAHKSGEPPFSLFTAYQILTLPNPQLRFHFLDQRFKLYLALFLAIGVNIPCDALTVNGRRVSPFPHVLADLVYRASSALAIFGLVGLEFHRFRLVRAVRGFLCLSVFTATGGVRSGHIRTENRADSFVDLLGCIALHLLGAMRIHVESGLHAFVSYGARQSLDIHAVVEGIGREGMAEIMEADTRKSSDFQQLFELTIDSARVQRPFRLEKIWEYPCAECSLLPLPSSLFRTSPSPLGRLFVIQDSPFSVFQHKQYHKDLNLSRPKRKSYQFKHTNLKKSICAQCTTNLDGIPKGYTFVARKSLKNGQMESNSGIERYTSRHYGIQSGAIEKINISRKLVKALESSRIRSALPSDVMWRCRLRHTPLTCFLIENSSFPIFLLNLFVHPFFEMLFGNDQPAPDTN